MITVSSRSGQGRTPRYFVIDFGDVLVVDPAKGSTAYSRHALGVMGRISTAFPGVRFVPRDNHSLEMWQSRYDGNNGLITAEAVQAAANNTAVGEQSAA